MSAQAWKYLDPDVAAKLPAMELRARRIVEGLFASLHRSPFRRFGVEFADYRKYEFGDEPRRIDWKLFSRTDKLYIKLFHNETNMRCYVLLDASLSMGYQTGKVSKLAYGCSLSAALAFLMLQQNDLVGLMTFDGGLRDYLGARGTRRHLAKILQCLEGLEPRSQTDVASICHYAARTLRRRGMVIVVSDLLGEPASILDGLRHLRSRHHDVIVFHVLDRAEREFPFKRLTLFRDVETARRLLVDARSYRDRYLETLNAFVEELKTGCYGAEIDYVGIDTSEPFDVALLSYLAKRSRM
jgi:uncharacterized protein (DUF58 family)